MRSPECHPEKPHVARGLCKRCYDRASREGRLNEYPLESEFEPDEIAVDRAVEWAIHTYKNTTKKERNAGRADRPRLTRVEKVEALRRAERFIPRTVAARLLSVQ